MKYSVCDGNSYVYPNQDVNEDNLTKRELFAAMAMQGILSNKSTGLNEYSPWDIAQMAHRQADELIEELNNEVQS
jgi:hypothetical protein